MAGLRTRGGAQTSLSRMRASKTTSPSEGCPAWRFPGKCIASALETRNAVVALIQCKPEGNFLCMWN